MTKQEESIDDDDDELRPEYDLSKLKFIGRGIYAERFRRGTNLAGLIERDREVDEETKEEGYKRDL